MQRLITGETPANLGSSRKKKKKTEAETAESQNSAAETKRSQTDAAKSGSAASAKPSASPTLDSTSMSQRPAAFAQSVFEKSRTAQKEQSLEQKYRNSTYAELKSDLDLEIYKNIKAGPEEFQAGKEKIAAMTELLPTLARYEDGSAQLELERLKKEKDEAAELWLQAEVDCNRAMYRRVGNLSLAPYNKTRKDAKEKYQKAATVLENFENRYYYLKQYAEAKKASKVTVGDSDLWSVAQNSRQPDGLSQNNMLLPVRNAAAISSKVEESRKQREAERIAAEQGIDYERLTGYAKRLQDAESMAESNQAWADFTEKHGVLASAASVPLSVLGGVGMVSELAQGIPNMFRESEDKIPINSNDNWHYGSQTSGTIRNTEGDKINQYWEDKGHPLIGNAAEKMYHFGMNAVDMAAATAVGNGVASVLGAGTQADAEVTSTLLSSKSAVQTFLDQKDMGKSDSAALNSSLITFSLEMLPESFTLEGIVGKNAEQGMKGVFKSAAQKGSQEALTEALQIGLDVAANKDGSDLIATRDKYIQNGMSRGEADRKVAADTLKRLGVVFLQGAANGASADVAQMFLNKWEQNRLEWTAAGENILAEGLEQDAIEAALAMPPDSEARNMTELYMEQAQTAQLEQLDALEAKLKQSRVENEEQLQALARAVEQRDAALEALGETTPAASLTGEQLGRISETLRAECAELTAAGNGDIINTKTTAYIETLKSKNMKLEGEVHPVTGVPFERYQVEKNGVAYEIVAPRFESFYTVQLPEELYSASNKKQFKVCNLETYHAVMEDAKLCELFDDSQLYDLSKGITPSGYVWHHSVVTGEMQLVDRLTHEKTGHTGGRFIWGGGTKRKK